MRLPILALILVLVGGAISCAPPKKDAFDDKTTIPVAATDSEMVAAIAKARSTLPEF